MAAVAEAGPNAQAGHTTRAARPSLVFRKPLAVYWLASPPRASSA